MARKATFLFTIFALLFISACAATPTVAPESLPTVTLDEANWIIIQIVSFEILKTPSDLDQVDEFKLILVAGGENEKNAAQFLYPARNNISVPVGYEKVTGPNSALAVNAKAIGDEILIYFAGFDVDEVDNWGNFFINLGNSAVSTLVEYSLAKSPFVSDGAAITTDLALGNLSDTLQEDDLIGEGIFSLSASNAWGVGETHTITDANNGLRLTYQVTTSEVIPGEMAATTDDELPGGYILFDSFTRDTLSSRWWQDDPEGVCEMPAEGGTLAYWCTNNPKSNTLTVTLHPNGMPNSAEGIYTVMKVTHSGGIAKPITNWICDGEPDKTRAYHLELGYDYAKAVEFFPNDPQQPWHEVTLTQIPVSPNKFHSLRIEHRDDTILFYLDDELLPLHTQPSLPACAVMRDWGFDFSLWPDNNTIAGQIDLVGILYSEP